MNMDSQLCIIEYDVIVECIRRTLYQILDEKIVDEFMYNYMDYAEIEKFLKENCEEVS